MTDSEGHDPVSEAEAAARLEQRTEAVAEPAEISAQESTGTTLAELEALGEETKEALEALDRTSWAFEDLKAVLDGTVKRTEATMFCRSDGVPLIYPGKTHAFVGESESLKSWAALAACAERLHLGEVILYIDFEDDKITFAERLLALGVSEDTIRDKAAYIRPIEPLGDEKTRRDIGLVAEHYGNPTLVVLDGVTECMMLHDWDPNVGTDVAKFLEFYPRRMASTGAALIFIDHVPKSKGSHERYAIGSVHKLKGIDGASYTFEIKRELQTTYTPRSKADLRSQPRSHERKGTSARRIS